MDKLILENQLVIMVALLKDANSSVTTRLLKQIDNTKPFVDKEQETNEAIELPDIYAGELNTKRIKKYKFLHEKYNVEEGTVRDIFCAGADWYKEIAEKDIKIRKHPAK